MREITTKIMKSVGRIAICSIGGVFLILGIMLSLGALVQLPDDVSKFIPYVVLGIMTLSIGLSLCFLVIKPMRYFVKSRKMSKEEKTIESIKKYLKQRKSNIAAITFVLVLMVFSFILLIMKENKLAETSEDIKLLNLAKIIVLEFYFLGFTGLLIGTLIIEISGHKRSQYRLTVSMWERIQELENEVKELKAGAQEDN